MDTNMLFFPPLFFMDMSEYFLKSTSIITNCLICKVREITCFFQSTRMQTIRVR
jgi:hypothetical protein